MSSSVAEVRASFEDDFYQRFGLDPKENAASVDYWIEASENGEIERFVMAVIKRAFEELDNTEV